MTPDEPQAAEAAPPAGDLDRQTAAAIEFALLKGAIDRAVEIAVPLAEKLAAQVRGAPRAATNASDPGVDEARGED